MKLRQLLSVLILSPLLASTAQAGDVASGEKTFKRCKSCHAIPAADGTDIVKGGRTGPNLFGVIGRAAGSEDGFKYGDSLAAAGAAGIVWDEENLAAYATDPKAWLAEVLDDPKAKTKMTFKLKKGGDDVAAYLASLASS